MAKDVAAAVAKSVDKVEKKLLQSLQKTQAAQGQVSRTHLAAESAKVKDEVVKAVARDVREPVLTAFRGCFQELLIPSLENSTQRMFSQIDASLAERFAALPAPTASRPKKAPPPPVTPKAEIEGLLGERKYDEALMKALGAQDLELVTWLCGKVEPSIMHDSEPLSQTVLVCLLQQLGAELQTDTAMKVSWLKEIALNLDQNSAEIAAHAPQVVAEIQTKVREFQATEAGKAVRTELSLILRVL